MAGQVLRLLVVFLLLGSAYGIACYRCQTRKILDGPKVDKEPEAVVTEGKEGDNLPPGGRHARATDPKKKDAKDKGKETAGTAEGRAAAEKKKKENDDFDILDCLKDGTGKDDKENWEEFECPAVSRACYIMKGTVVIREERNVTKYEITRRACYTKNDPFLVNSPHKVDERTKTVHKTSDTKFKLSGSADITVCDDLDGGRMLCNGGVARMVNYFASLSLVIILCAL